MALSQIMPTSINLIRSPHHQPSRLFSNTGFGAFWSIFILQPHWQSFYPIGHILSIKSAQRKKSFI